jgi:hypothetical protein
VLRSSHPPERFGHERLHGVLAYLVNEAARLGGSLQHINGLVQIVFSDRKENCSRLAAFLEDLRVGDWLGAGKSSLFGKLEEFLFDYVARAEIARGNDTRPQYSEAFANRFRPIQVWSDMICRLSE